MAAEDKPAAELKDSGMDFKKSIPESQHTKTGPVQHGCDHKASNGRPPCGLPFVTDVFR